MRTEAEIMDKAADLQQRLEEAAALWQQASRQALPMPELELLIIALVDKLEILFWILDIELANPEILGETGRLYN